MTRSRPSRTRAIFLPSSWTFCIMESPKGFVNRFEFPLKVARAQVLPLSRPRGAIREKLANSQLQGRPPEARMRGHRLTERAAVQGDQMAPRQHARIEQRQGVDEVHRFDPRFPRVVLFGTHPNPAPPERNQ